MTLGYADGVTTQSSVLDLTGIAQTPAVLVLSHSPAYNFGNLANGATADATLTVVNGGNSPATERHRHGPEPHRSRSRAGAIPGAGGTCTATVTVGFVVHHRS